jgi:hypothetical protein
VARVAGVAADEAEVLLDEWLLDFSVMDSLTMSHSRNKPCFQRFWRHRHSRLRRFLVSIDE